MTNHKHNPYVGSFHSKDRSELTALSPLVVDSRNGMLPMFRHAPSMLAPSLMGLKCLIESKDCNHHPIELNQVLVSEEMKKSKKMKLTRSVLKSLPVSIFALSAVLVTDPDSPIDDAPICSICLENFADGDELRTLKCSHCYHKGCIDLWLLGCMSDATTSTCHCPDCRQELVMPINSPPSPVHATTTSTSMSMSTPLSMPMASSQATVMCGSFVNVSSVSFLRLGRSMSVGGESPSSHAEGVVDSTDRDHGFGLDVDVGVGAGIGFGVSASTMLTLDDNISMIDEPNDSIEGDEHYEDAEEGGEDEDELCYSCCSDGDSDGDHGYEEEEDGMAEGLTASVDGVESMSDVMRIHACNDLLDCASVDLDLDSPSASMDVDMDMAMDMAMTVTKSGGSELLGEDFDVLTESDYHVCGYPYTFLQRD